MTDLPHMPFYWERFFADTRFLAADQQGIYALLLGHMWLNQGWLSADDAILARLLGLDVRTWRSRYWPALRPYFGVEIDPMCGAILRQKRLVAERSKALEVVERNKARTAAATAERLKKSGKAPHVTNGAAQQRNVDRHVPRSDPPHARAEPEPDRTIIGDGSGSPLPPAEPTDARSEIGYQAQPPASLARGARVGGSAPLATPASAREGGSGEGLKPVGETDFMRRFRASQAGDEGALTKGKDEAPIQPTRPKGEMSMWDRVNARFDKPRKDEEP